MWIVAIALVCLIIIVVYDPSFDVIYVNGRRRPIMWYNSTNGRTWMFL